VTAAERPGTIHDFYGFPRELFAIDYAAPGEPRLARRVVEMLREGGMEAAIDERRGLDHGAWSPLRLVYPDAGVAVVQVSLPLALRPEELFRMGALLESLRGEGVMVMGSGGIVHNLGRLDFGRRDREPFAWVVEFDAWFQARAAAGKLEELFRYAS